VETSDFGRATDRDGHTPPPTPPIPAVECPSRRFLDVNPQISTLRTDRKTKEGRNCVCRTHAIAQRRTLLITVARVDEKLKLNVIPAKVKEGEEHALTTPLKLYWVSRGVGFRIRQTPCQLRRLSPCSRQYLGRSQGGNERGGKGSTPEGEDNATGLEG
jgi:hypothetical protein